MFIFLNVCCSFIKARIILTSTQILQRTAAVIVTSGFVNTPFPGEPWHERIHILGLHSSKRISGVPSKELWDNWGGSDCCERWQMLAKQKEKNCWEQLFNTPHRYAHLHQGSHKRPPTGVTVPQSCGSLHSCVQIFVAWCNSAWRAAAATTRLWWFKCGHCSLVQYASTFSFIGSPRLIFHLPFSQRAICLCCLYLPSQGRTL